MTSTAPRHVHATVGTQRAPVQVFSPSAYIGGVEGVARQVHAALMDAGGPARLHVGLGGVVRSPRPHGSWMSLTWKTHTLVGVRHPGVLKEGLLWLHGAELTRDAGSLQRRARDRILHEAAALLAVSPLAVQLLPPDLRPRAELVGPPISPARGVTSRSRPDGEVRLLSVGRAVPRKGHDLAIEAARELATSIPTRLDVVGPGPDLARLCARAAGVTRPGLKVAIHGGVPEEVKQRLYADADVLLFLPRTEAGEFEGLGLVVLEAATHGCPAVVLECGGSGFSIVDGRTGVLLAAGATPGAVAEAAWRLHVSDTARADTTKFAEEFALPAWRRRVLALATGEHPDWQWPDLAGGRM